MKSQERAWRIREKFSRDWRHVKYLLEKGWHPLEIADQMTQYTILTLREGIRQRHPEFNDREILQEMRKKISNSQLQEKRGLRKNGGT